MLLCKIDRLQEQMKSTRTKQTERKLFADQFCCSAMWYCLHNTMIRINQRMPIVKASVTILHLITCPRKQPYILFPLLYSFIHSKVMLLQRCFFIIYTVTDNSIERGINALLDNNAIENCNRNNKLKCCIIIQCHMYIHYPIRHTILLCILDFRPWIVFRSNRTTSNLY
jgi:hypothetical protein